MLDNHILVFDIESVADTDSYRRLNHLDAALSDADVYQIMAHERLATSGNTFQRHYLQRIVALSLLLDTPKGLKLWSLGRGEETEKDIVQRFFQGIDKLTPTLVSWNGSGFDLPVLHYRALFHGITARQYFDVGDENRDFRYNNYLGRFHWRHIDVMDVLADYQARAVASLNDIARLCGMPGKLAVDGGKVQDMWFAGEREAICDYCETDVLNTYGVYLRFELLRGNLNSSEYASKYEALQEFVGSKDAPHLQAFFDQWLAEQQ